MRRALLIVAALLVLLGIVVPAGALWSVLATEGGLRFLAAHLPHRLGELTIGIEGVSGTLLEGIRIERIDVDHRLAHVQVRAFSARIRLLPLLWQTVRTTDAHARHIEVRLKPHTPALHPGPPAFLPRGVMVSLEHARIDTGLLLFSGGDRFGTQDMSASAVIRQRHIRIFDAQLDNGFAHYAARGELRAADPLRLEGEVRAFIHPEGQPAWTFLASGRGDLDDVPFQGHLSTPFRAEVTGHARGLGSRFNWQALAQIRDLDVNAWGLGTVLGVMPGTLSLHGETTQFGATGTLIPPGLHAGPFHVEFEGGYGSNVLTARSMLVRHTGSGASARGAGTFTIVPHGPFIDIAGTWRDFRWPLTGPVPGVNSGEGEFSLRGIAPYAVHLRGIGRGLFLPDMPIEVDGMLGHDAFEWARGTAQLYGGRASTQGELRWAPAQGWTLRGDFAEIDTTTLRGDLPGRIGFHLSTHGAGYGPTDDADVALEQLAGRVRGLPAHGSGQLHRRGGHWGAEGVRVALGANELAADGRLDPEPDLRFELSADDLRLFAADSQGSVRARGRVRGSWAQPVLVLSAHGRGLRHAGTAVERLDGEVDFEPARDHQSRGELRIAGLGFAGRHLDSAVLTLSGPATQLALSGELRSADLHSEFAAGGAWADGSFAGRLESLRLAGGDAMQLALQRPVELRVGPRIARIEWFCLDGRPGAVCADASWSPAAWSATASAHALPVGVLTAGFDPRIRYDGRVDVLGRALGGDGPVRGTVRIELNDVGFEHRLPSHRVEHVRLGTGSVLASATPDTLSLDATVGSGAVGSLRLNLAARRGPADWRELQVAGELHARTDQLGLLSLYVPDIDRAAGTLSADARISGTAGAPLLAGSLQLADAEMDFYPTNLRIRHLALDARLTENGVDYSGSAQLGAGHLSTSGKLAWRASLPYGRLTLKGTDLRVVDVPEARIDASPDLAFAIAGRHIDVTGTVIVPYARIEPVELSNAIRPSDDEVIVGAEARDADQRFEVASAITLALGDRVTIDTRGLTGRLTGNISVVSGVDAITRATGELSIEQGRYRAYAHNMDVERGRLLFTGGAIDDPGIDIRAARRFPDVKAGVNVRGTLQQPRISLFSEPALPQSQVASLLLSGSIEGTTTRQTGAGNTALVQGGAILAQQLGSRIGIEDVGVQSNLLTNDTSLVIGRYLSPRFYVSYGVSLTQALNVLKLRYSLGDHWTLSTEVGQARGADLVFSIIK